MRHVHEIDPELHQLRSIARAVPDPHGVQMENARFALYKAFAARDPDAAMKWATAVRAALLALNVEQTKLFELGTAALDHVERSIHEEPGTERTGT